MRRATTGRLSFRKLTGWTTSVNWANRSSMALCRHCKSPGKHCQSDFCVADVARFPTRQLLRRERTIVNCWLSISISYFPLVFTPLQNGNLFHPKCSIFSQHYVDQSLDRLMIHRSFPQLIFLQQLTDFYNYFPSAN